MIARIDNNRETGKGTDKVGSVLVVGAGIAGMQTALDCANGGLKVYLLEQLPCIGGNMARLDKTFPTNDCAMCMISPKLVETGRHLNIEIISYADLERIEGEAGNFRVRVRKKARYVDEVTCNGCADCEKACPVKIKDNFNGLLADRKAIYRLYPQAIPNVFTIDKIDLDPPCRGTCPAGVNAHGYIALIAKGRFLEALDLVRERMPFAGICGRICDHPCEQACNRGEIDEAVSIRNLKRFVADYEMDRIRKGLSIEREPSEIVVPEKPVFSEKVAIIGGGPAGLACAADLVKTGYSATVFDADKKPGGTMRTGIPAYRLPRDFLDREIDLVLKQGINVESEKKLGRDFSLDDLKTQGYQSVFIATGARHSKPLRIEGSEAKGVYDALSFLREVNEGGRPDTGGKVVVIGGGNAAMDAARAAARVKDGTKVSIVYRRTRREMPAIAEEIDAALEEGIEIGFLTAPAKIVAESGRVVGLECVKMELAEPDESGRRRPVPIEGSEFVVDADTVIVAIGQESDLSPLEDEMKTEHGLVVADKLTLETSREGVFAGGDNVLGPSSFVQAVAHGHRAAESIHLYLRGLDMRNGRKPVEQEKEFADIPDTADRSVVPRKIPVTADPAERKSSFAEIEGVFTEEEAIAEAKRCLDCGGCCECLECVRVCKPHAVRHDMKEDIIDLNVGAVVLTSGYEPFDASLKSEYGFGRYPNVVTGLQYERILSASGPYEGHLRRPSDGRTPQKIAWIQCVGSRDVTIGNDYCSSVCCMYATKQAIMTKEHESAAEATIFYIDLRAFGKGFEEFYNRAKDISGVRYVRSQISALKENPANGNIIMRYISEEPGGGIVEEEFDIVVLSIGIVANSSAGKLADIAGIDCNRFGFAIGRPDETARSTKDGIFLSGAVGGPKDIPETVMQGSAAAALCGELLAPARGTKTQPRKYPPEKDVAGMECRIGVFVCHCGTNISSVIDVEAVAKYAGGLEGVVHAEDTLYSCSQDTQERMKDIIRDKDLNRVLVASCTPRTHEPLFRETLREGGLNEYLFEMVNIREQCSWVHQKEPQSSTEKARALVRGGVAKCRLLQALQLNKVGVTKSALVIGGGISGMSTALSLARQGFKVHLVEKSNELGGNLRHIKRSLAGYDWQEYLRHTIKLVGSDENIDIYLNCEIDEASGFVGNFRTKLKGADTCEIEHGVIVVATGAEQYEPSECLYGQDDRVVTQRGLEEILHNPDESNPNSAPRIPQSIVMIQCIGCRIKERPYCSRVCCGQAVKNALAVKEKDPDANVYILYRDMRTYEFKEEYYRKAREQGVVFIRFPDDEYPEVSKEGPALSVSVHDALIGEKIRLTADLVVLSAASISNRESNQRLSEILRVPLDENGFFMEAHVKLRPVDFANEGVFVCGMAHSPKYTEENISQALAAAGRAACILSRDSLEVGGAVAVIDPEKCASCLTCVRECAYDAPFMNADGVAEIEAAKCQGCGNCAAACPAKAIQLNTFTDKQEIALFRNILQE